MNKRVPLQVTVKVAGSTIAYSDGYNPWATSVEVTRSGDLKIWQGWRVRVFHPAGEWLSYTVEPRA